MNNYQFNLEEEVVRKIVLLCPNRQYGELEIKTKDYFTFFKGAEIPQGVDYDDINSVRQAIPLEELHHALFVFMKCPPAIVEKFFATDEMIKQFKEWFKTKYPSFYRSAIMNMRMTENTLRTTLSETSLIYYLISSMPFKDLEDYVQVTFDNSFDLKGFVEEKLPEWYDEAYREDECDTDDDEAFDWDDDDF